MSNSFFFNLYFSISFRFSDIFLYAFQISKKQHELVVNMKQTGKSIQSRSLNRVLGNLDDFHVQSYEVFIKEEQKKLHEHWLVCCLGQFFSANLLSFHTQQNVVLKLSFYCSLERINCIGCNWLTKTSLWHMQTGHRG